MTRPDWSKAPEGATHWAPETEKFLESWYKNSGGIWWFQCVDYGPNWLLSSALPSEGNLVPRPHTEGKIIPDTGETRSDDLITGESKAFLDSIRPSPAHKILCAAAGHMKDRAATYDKPEGERSMAATVEAFKAVSGVNITEEQGWIFMLMLKAVRSQQGAYRADSYEDGAAYFALAGEAAIKDRADE